MQQWVDALGDIIDILVGGLTSMGTGIAGGITNFVQGLMFTTSGETTTLSPFIAAVALFAAIGLAVGLTKWVSRWIQSLGAKKAN